MVAKSFDDLENALFCLFADVSPFVHHERDGGERTAGFPCDIFNSRTSQNRVPIGKEGAGCLLNQENISKRFYKVRQISTISSKK